jgi:hypothetical protein
MRIASAVLGGKRGPGHDFGYPRDFWDPNNHDHIRMNWKEMREFILTCLYSSHKQFPIHPRICFYSWIILRSEQADEHRNRLIQWVVVLGNRNIPELYEFYVFSGIGQCFWFKAEWWGKDYKEKLVENMTTRTLWKGNVGSDETSGELQLKPALTDFPQGKQMKP